MSLTAKMEVFTLAIFAGIKPIPAHKQAYPNKMKDKTRGEAASRLLKNSKVIARLKELRGPAAEVAAMTLDSHLADLLSLRNMSAKANQFGSAVSAEIARGKASGVGVPEKLEVSGPKGQPLMQPVLNVTISPPTK